ncbi:Hypothetical protein R9X50_00764800 [Acrodontium crateriforme]|uniref:Uncharacterized protein n=1 Tax=Acrodontium crateriforme TaxID=150365 RepID=A0AAQ3RE91_9PEZI|nr:Hypothetical protein R9X50_00764800 [Acrodontium crateriforme]
MEQRQDSASPSVIKRKPVPKKDIPAPSTEPHSGGAHDDRGDGTMPSSIPPQWAASIKAEHPLFYEVRALVHLATEARIEALCKYFGSSTDYHVDASEAQAIMDWVLLMKDAKRYGPWFPFPVPQDKLRTAHYMVASIIKTTLLDENVKTTAQMLALEPPMGAPTNRSYFEVQPIKFAYNAELYQRDFNYRHWIGERALEMTDTTSLEEWKQELDQRYHNRPRMGVIVDPNPQARYFMGDPQAEAFFGAMQRTNHAINNMIQERNNSLEKQSTGWARNPGVVGPALLSGLSPLPKLPEMHTGTAGEAPPDDEYLYLSQTKRFPMARNWTTLEEFFRFPLSLRAVNPSEFRQHDNGPEVLFTDRFGVIMCGVGQTPQCTAENEHDIFTMPISKLQGYDQTLASHGITYEDYRKMILGLLFIIHKSMEGPCGETNSILTGSVIKKFFEGVSENLRARGSPVVVKYKKASKYYLSHLSVRHHPFGALIRGRLGKKLNSKG